MNEKWPFNRQTIATPGNVGGSSINPMPSVPGERFMRSIDPPATGGGPGGGGGSFNWPLKLVAVDSENVKVVYGTVNGADPTNIETNIDVSGTDATWAIYLRAILNPDGSIVVTDVTSDNTNTVPADDDSNAYIRVGAVTVAASEITTVLPSLAWSQTFVTCGRDPDDPTTTPGTYYWVVA
jgi:hypothetical protein